VVEGVAHLADLGDLAEAGHRGRAAAVPPAQRVGFTSLGARKPWASWAIWSTIFRNTMKPRMDTTTAASSPICASVLWSSSWRESRYTNSRIGRSATSANTTEAASRRLMVRERRRF